MYQFFLPIEYDYMNKIALLILVVGAFHLGTIVGMGSKFGVEAADICDKAIKNTTSQIIASLRGTGSDVRATVHMVKDGLENAGINFGMTVFSAIKDSLMYAVMGGVTCYCIYRLSKKWFPTNYQVVQELEYKNRALMLQQENMKLELEHTFKNLLMQHCKSAVHIEDLPKECRETAAMLTLFVGKERVEEILEDFNQGISFIHAHA